MDSTIQRRLQSLSNHIQSNQTFNASKAVPKSDDDIVIVAMARTAITKAGKGLQKDTSTEDMLVPVLKAVIAQAKIDPKLIDDVCIGSVLQNGAGANQARMAMFMAGIPQTTTVKGVNRQCSSGLEAVIEIANSIRVNQIDMGIGGGVESMSSASLGSAFDVKKLSPKVFLNKLAKDVALINMGITSENVAERYGITREKQDLMAYESNQKAAKAMKAGFLQGEITQYLTQIKDKDGNMTVVHVALDDGVREETTLEGLAKLKPAFKKEGGTTTPGNASQVSDGAAAILLTRRSNANKLGLKIHGRIVSYACAGVAPDEMGVGPAYAIPAALKKAGLTLGDIDIFEINEAFASQATYTIEKLGIPREKLNPKGGAIALGHPVGMTGSRMIVTLFHELQRTNKRYGLVSMCMGTGMGACGVFERE